MTDAKPFIKYVGGKSWLADRILAALPEHPQKYIEPFVGGGAVFFAMANAQRFDTAVINDTCADLIRAYKAVRDTPVALMEALDKLQPFAPDEEAYYRIRAEEPTSDLDRTVRFVYLMKTGFRGLYRENKSGKFNTPFGHYKNPSLYDPDTIIACSCALARTTIIHGDYTDAIDLATRGDAVYFDPPYVPSSDTASFVNYTSGGFGEEDQRRLSYRFDKLTEAGIACVLSNAEAAQSLYAAHHRESVTARRAINPKHPGSTTTELLVLNKHARQTGAVA